MSACRHWRPITLRGQLRSSYSEVLKLPSDSAVNDALLELMLRVWEERFGSTKTRRRRKAGTAASAAGQEARVAPRRVAANDNFVFADTGATRIANDAEGS